MRPRKRLPHAFVSASERAWHLWWLNPVAIFSLVLLATSIPAYLIPESAYQSEWKTPKYLGSEEFLYILYAIAAFAAGGILARLVLPRRPYAGVRELYEKLYLPWNALRILFYATFGIILLAYAIWLALLVGHGVSLSTLAAGLSGEGNASFDIKDEGETLPGVTTLVQLEMAFMVLGLILVFRFGWRSNLRSLVLPLVTVGLIAWVRSKLWSERLAVTEMSVPALVLIVRLCGSEGWRLWKRVLLAAAPLAGPPLLFVFFSAAEFSRSWAYYGSSQDSFLLFSFMRLIGYYVTALNNGAAAVESVHHYALPYNTLEWFWKFPLVKALMPYESLTGVDPNATYLNLLSDVANPEFNNPSGVFVVRLDYGYIGGLFVWLAAGALAAILHRSFMSGRRAGLFLYPLFFVGLLESPRVFYWSLSRTFPSWALLIGILVLVLFTSQALRRPSRVRGGLITPAAAGPLPAPIAE